MTLTWPLVFIACRSLDIFPVWPANAELTSKSSTQHARILLPHMALLVILTFIALSPNRSTGLRRRRCNFEEFGRDLNGGEPGGFLTGNMQRIAQAGAYGDTPSLA
jgi:hypothetical protein